MSTLMAVILTLVDVDVSTARYNCHVRCAYMCTCVLTSHVFLGRDHLPFCECARLSPVVFSPRNERMSVPFWSSFPFQFFGYLTVAAASLLIVLRMYVCNLAMQSSIAHVYR